MRSLTLRSAPYLALLLVLILALALPALARGQAQVRSAALAPAPAHLAKAAPLTEPPVRIAAGLAVEPLASLAEAAVGAADQVAALAAWNRAGRRPLQTGIVRPLPLPRAVRFGAAVAAAPAGLHAGGAFARVGPGSTVWGASVEVASAHRLRLHLEGVDLPAGTRMWVYGDEGEAVPFGPELAHEGSLWTPSVPGPEIRLEVELPREALAEGGAPGFSVAGVAEIFRLGPDGAPVFAPVLLPRNHADCLVDVSCVGPAEFPALAPPLPAHKAIAHIQFVEGPFLFACSGGLLNLVEDSPPGLAPPFLTANHCLSTHGAAASIEAFWSFKTSSCDGPPPSLDSVPRTSGSQLLATNPQTDFTLLRLPFPPDAVLLGWNALNPILPANTVTHRISHPVPHFDILAQQYTRNFTKAVDERLLCGKTEKGADTDEPTLFHRSVFLEGGTFAGSSGAPLIRDNGQVVGQLFGACGENPTDGCSMDNDELDGNFYTTFGLIARFLGAEPPPPSTDWLGTAEQPGFEFQVRITPAGGLPIPGAMEPDCIVETFCASGALPGRPEAFIKIIGPRPNGFLWVQISRFTPSELEAWVRQVSSGQINYYRLPAVGAQSDDVSGLQDRTAFAP